MSTYTVGDIIRVTYEGRVRSVNAWRGEIDIGPGDTRLPECGATVEIIDRALRVGDTVEGESAYDALPVGSVVKGRRGESPVYVRGKTSWRNQDGELTAQRVGLSYPRTLVHIPEQ